MTVECFIKSFLVFALSLSEPRPNVGVVLVNKDKQVFVGRRPRRKDQDEDTFWQMPQGGIDGKEAPEDAAKRELCEEVGVPPDEVEILAVSKNWYSYDIPPEFQKRHFSAQTQKWFLMQYLGPDTHINVNQPKPEFCEWKWVEFKKVPKLVIEFKKEIYKQVFKDFGWFFEEEE